MKERDGIEAEHLDKLLSELREIPDEVSGAHLEPETLLAYVDEALDEPSRQVCEAHLASCPSCLVRIEAVLEASASWQGASGGTPLEKVRQRARGAGVLRLTHWGWRSMAAFLAGTAPDAAAIERHLHEERCESCPGLRDSAAVRMLARLMTAPETSAEALARFWESATFHASSLYGLPVGVTGSFAAGLVAAPSSLTFGGERQAEAGASWGVSIVGQPAAYPLGRLYSLNGRVLPDEAELYWGHEIWLVQLPFSVLLTGSGSVDAIGVKVRVADGGAQVLDILPQHRWLRTAAPVGCGSTCDVDLWWNGRITESKHDALSEATEVPLRFGGTVRLAENPGLVGQLSLPLGTAGVRTAVAGIDDATCLFETGTEGPTFTGSICVLVVAEKRRVRLDLDVLLWLEGKGLNGVPMRVAGVNARTQADLMTDQAA